MKKKLIVLATSIVFTFTGCFNYRDINRVLFDTAVLIDIDENDEIIIYTESFKSFKGTAQGVEQGVRLINKARGKTLFEAVRNMNLSSGYKHNYTQNKALMFSERAAQKGLGKVLDFIDRDQEFLVRPFVFVYLGDVERLFKLQIKDEEYLGVYIYSLINNIGSASRAIIVNKNEFLNRRLQKSKTELLTVLRIKKEAMMERIELDGAAVLEADKMVEYLPKEKGQGYNFLSDEVETGTLEVTNPSNPAGYVTLEILKSKTKTNIEYDGEKIKLKKTIKVKTSIGEAQYKFLMTKENIAKLEKNTEDNIKKYTMQLFKEYQIKELDIFEIADELYRHYPKVKIEKPITVTDLEVNADVTIEGSSNKLNKY